MAEACYADYLRAKYHLLPEDEEEQDDRPSTASISAFTGGTEDLFVDQRRPATGPRPRTTGGGGGARHNADRLSRNRAAKRAVTDVTTYNHVSTLYHMNRRIQEMWSKSGRKGYSPPGRVGTVDAVELGHGGSGYWGGGGGGGSRPGTASSFSTASGRPLAGSRPGTGYGGGTPRIPGAPTSPPSHHAPSSYQRPGSAPSPGGGGALGYPTHYQHHQQQQQHPRPATSLGAAGGGGSPARGRGEAGAPAPSFTERRVRNSAQALKQAILGEIVENRIYEERRLKQLFRSYLKLNSGEAFYPTLVQVIEELKAELDIAK